MLKTASNSSAIMLVKLTTFRISTITFAYLLACVIIYSLIYPICNFLYCLDDTSFSLLSQSWFPRTKFLGLIRWAYNWEVKGLSFIYRKMTNEGKTTEEIAVVLYNLRIEKREKYQLVTPTKERQEIYNRNLALYKDRIAPTLDYLRTVKAYTWEEIAAKAMTPDKETNKRFGVK
ncbi:hypothetical protein H6F77_08920 [Microcoleus sp. FACHB-831]|uniref:hypothetical protein n=1 Tax=Microcoleus sp. FACHB-831 TaxID=2692827 RepID=UPI001689F98B|nr:hypothetical protein [Microcoleus sp. FACHB-831]MBD1921213.1 hypothetical protein [Microcoleus sp. FACHB-831]